MRRVAVNDRSVGGVQNRLSVRLTRWEVGDIPDVPRDRLAVSVCRFRSSVRKATNFGLARLMMTTRLLACELFRGRIMQMTSAFSAPASEAAEDVCAPRGARG